MADEQQYSADELAQIQELLEPLQQDPAETFSPMREQYQRDLREVKPPEEEDPFAEMAAGQTEGDAAGGGADFGGGSDFADAGASDASDAGPDLSALEGLFEDAASGGADDSDDPGESAETGAADSGEFDIGSLDFGEALSGGEAAEAGDDAGEGGFGDLGDLDFSAGDEADAPSGDAGDFDPAGLGDLGDLDPGADADQGDAGNFGDPGDLDFSAGDAAVDAEDAGGAGDFGDLGDLDFGGGGEAGDAGSLDSGGDEFDLPSEDAGGGIDWGDFGETDEGGGEFDLGSLGSGDAGDVDSGEAAGAGAATAGASEGFDLDDLANLDLGPGASPEEEAPVADASGGADEGFGDFDSGAGLELGGDDFGDFDSGGGLDLGGDTAGGEFGDDFGLGEIGGDVAASPVDSSLGDDLGGDLTVDTDDLADMSQAAQMQSGIGDEFTDEELAKIRQALVDYPPGLRKSVIDVVVNEKISQPDQRLLVNMVVDQAEPEQLADFIEARLGYRPDVSPSEVTKEGVRIIYTDEVSPESLAKRRQRNRLILAGAAAAVLGIFAIFGGWRLLDWWSIEGKYEQGVEELIAARETLDEAERLRRKEAAEQYYNEALAADGGQLSSKWMNRYGIAYMNAGYFEDGFRKLYGEAEPDYGEQRPESAWTWPERRAPLIRLLPGERWRDAEERARGLRPVFTARDEIRRTAVLPGAYMVDRLRDQEMERQTLINLARFHSNRARNFVDGEAGARYKNDELAIDYYRLILTVMNLPEDVEAMAGIGDIYYQQAAYGAAVREYNGIIEKFPTEIRGHAGLLNTYIELWKRDGDPRLVLARHREIRQLGLEEDLPLYLTAKLAAFYIDLDEDDIRIQYQVDPVDAVSGLGIRDNARHLLELVFNKTETRDGETINGARYGEGFYQRGRFLASQNETLQAVKQYQNAHNFDPRHWLAVNAMGEYYKHQLDFDRAAGYFRRAVEIHNDWVKTAGNRPEDETLIDGDFGKVFYNLGSLIFLRYAGFQTNGQGDMPGFPDTRIYPDRASAEPESPQMQKRREELLRSRGFFEQALKENLRDQSARTNLIYWLGWIDYMSGDFESALMEWDRIDPLYSNSDSSLLMARGNAYYYTEQLRAALGSYLKLKDDLERQTLGIETPNPENEEQRRVFLGLAAVYNNIGAVYEQEYIELARRGGDPRTLRELEENALKYYWNAVEVSRQMDDVNELARSNVQLAFKYSRSASGREFREPLLDDWAPPALASLRDEL